MKIENWVKSTGKQFGKAFAKTQLVLKLIEMETKIKKNNDQ